MLAQVDHLHQKNGRAFLKDVFGLLSKHIDQRNDTDVPVQNIIRPDLLRKLIPFDSDEIADPNELLSMCEKIIEHSTQTQHPYFVSQLYGSPDPYGLAADMIISALNSNVHVYDLAPVLTLIEKSVVAYLSEKFGFATKTDKGDGIFVPGASTGTQYALHLARYLKQPVSKIEGSFQDKPLVAYCSEAAHYSCSNSAVLLGIGSENMRKIECDKNGVILLNKLRDAIQQSYDVGKQPFCVIATAGTTVLGGFDPIDAIADLAHDHNLWLHVDAAWGGAAAFSSSQAHLMSGVQRADSLVFNAHKILGLPIQCSALLVNSRQGHILTEAISIHAPYLHQSDRVTHEENLDISKATFQCGRKGDALKFWLFKQAVGDIGITSRVDSCVDIAENLALKIQERAESKGSFLLKSNSFATTCFWYIPKKYRDQLETDNLDDISFDLGSIAPKIKEHMLANGYNCMLGYASSPNIPTFFRWAVTNPPTELNFIERDLDRILDMIEDVGEKIF